MAIVVVLSLKILTFLFRFQMVFDKTAAICLDFKLQGFRISNPLKSGPFATQPLLELQNPDQSGFRILTEVGFWIFTVLYFMLQMEEVYLHQSGYLRQRGQRQLQLGSHQARLQRYRTNFKTYLQGRVCGPKPEGRSITTTRLNILSLLYHKVEAKSTPC